MGLASDDMAEGVKERRNAEFKKEDVVKVAEAVVFGCMDFDNSDTREYGWSCHFCGTGHAEGGGLNGNLDMAEAAEVVKHKTDCPVLVARDLLT